MVKIHIKYSNVNKNLCGLTSYFVDGNGCIRINSHLLQFYQMFLKGSYDAISSFASSFECYKLIVHR